MIIVSRGDYTGKRYFSPAKVMPEFQKEPVCIAFMHAVLYNGHMEYLVTSFQTVMPLLIMMAVGFLLRRINLVQKDVFLVVNRIVFYVGLPCLIFHNLITKQNSSDADWGVVLVCVAGIVILFALSWLIMPHIEKDPRRRGAISQAAIRSNDSIFALTVAATILGEGNFGMTIFTSALSATALNLMSIITLEMNRGGRFKFLPFLKHVLTNPVIISVAAGYLFRLTGWTMPEFLLRPIHHFSNMVPPLGFLTLGGILSFHSIQENRKAITGIVITKLILVPLIMTCIALLLGFRGDRLLTVLLIFAAPTAMASYPMAAALDSDAELAGEAVAVTTACALPTVFLFLTAFGGLL